MKFLFMLYTIPPQSREVPTQLHVQAFVKKYAMPHRLIRTASTQRTSNPIKNTHPIVGTCLRHVR